MTANAGRGLRLLLLHTDGYGTPGGMAAFNRGFVAAALASGRTARVSVVSMFDGPGRPDVPPEVTWYPVPPGDKVGYARRALAAAARGFDLVVCGHINLMPLGLAAARLARARLWTQSHGIEIWQPPRGRLHRWSFEHNDRVLTVSAFSRARILEWARLAPERVQVIHNTVDPDRFTLGPRNPELVARYGLAGRRVLMTVARLAASEQRKGHDRVIAVMPKVVEAIPNATYLIVGDGDDRPRLEALVRDHGMADRVVFTGFVDDLCEHYRLADLYVMPSRGDGFGIVFLEAACCGVPSLGSSDDAGGEVATRLGGRATASGDPDRLAAAIVEGLRDAGPPDPDLRGRAIELYGPERYRARVGELLATL